MSLPRNPKEISYDQKDHDDIRRKELTRFEEDYLHKGMHVTHIGDEPALLADIPALLLDRRIHPDAKLDGIPLLHLALRYGRDDVAEFLIMYGANLELGYDGLFPDRVSPLVVAMFSEAFPSIELMIRHKADVNSRCRGFTPLMFGRDDKRIIKLLLEHQADVNAVTEGITALGLARVKAGPEVISILETAAKSADIKKNDAPVKDRGKEEENSTPSRSSCCAIM